MSNSPRYTGPSTDQDSTNRRGSPNRAPAHGSSRSPGLNRGNSVGADRATSPRTQSPITRNSPEEYPDIDLDRAISMAERQRFSQTSTAVGSGRTTPSLGGSTRPNSSHRRGPFSEGFDQDRLSQLNLTGDLNGGPEPREVIWAPQNLRPSSPRPGDDRRDSSMAQSRPASSRTSARPDNTRGGRNSLSRSSSRNSDEDPSRGSSSGGSSMDRPDGR